MLILEFPCNSQEALAGLSLTEVETPAELVSEAALGREFIEKTDVF